MPMSGISIAKSAIEIYAKEFKPEKSSMAILTLGVINEKEVQVLEQIYPEEVDSKLAEAIEGGFKQKSHDGKPEPNNMAYIRYLFLKDQTPKYAAVKLESPIGKSIVLVFLAWIPNDCPVRKRMVASSIKDDLFKKLEGLKINATCHDESDLDYMDIISKSR